MLSYKLLKDLPEHYENYSITAVQANHIERIRIWRNQQLEHLRQIDEITCLQQKNYYKEKIWSELDSPSPTNMLFSFLYGNTLIGYGGLVHVSWVNRRAEVSFLIETERRKNKSLYAQDFKAFHYLLELISKRDLNLNRIFTETYSFRKFQIELLEQNGFVTEGVLKQHVLVDDMAHDSIIQGKLLK